MRHFTSSEFPSGPVTSRPAALSLRLEQPHCGFQAMIAATNLVSSPPLSCCWTLQARYVPTIELHIAGRPTSSRLTRASHCRPTPTKPPSRWVAAAAANAAAAAAPSAARRRSAKRRSRCPATTAVPAPPAAAPRAAHAPRAAAASARCARCSPSCRVFKGVQRKEVGERWTGTDNAICNTHGEQKLMHIDVNAQFRPGHTLTR